MISYKDLTCYCLHHFENSYNVGWIDVKDDFPKASLSQEFIAKLWEYIKFPLNVHRSSNDSVLVHYNGEKKTLGFSEIRVLSKDGLKKYAAPDLIFHYVTKYNYCPQRSLLRLSLQGQSLAHQNTYILCPSIKKRIYGEKTLKSLSYPRCLERISLATSMHMSLEYLKKI